MEDDLPIKVVFLGENYVGKTCLINKYITGEFKESHLITTSTYSKKTINFNGKDYIFDIWDTPGYEKYRPLAKLFMKGAKIIVLVYDITKKKSFLELDFFLDTILERLGNEVFLILVGNKMDLYENEEIREEDGKKFAKIIKARFSLVSAKEDNNIWNIFFENALKEYIQLREK